MINPGKKSNKENSHVLKLTGSNYFRQKIAYSLLFSKSIEISNIRPNEVNPGLTDYEISFLRLIEKISNGTLIDISKTGTVLKFTPGVITNNYGNEFDFECHTSRAITYFAEGIILISMYGKESLLINFIGVTNNDIDISVDTFKGVTCALLQKLVVGDTVICEIKRRGVFPKGNGKVKFKCPIITMLNAFDWIDEGKVKRVRGTAFSSKIPASFTTRMVDAGRRCLNNFLPDVWIAVDNYKDKNKDNISPGFGLSLVGETTNDFYFAFDEVNSDNQTPEEIAEKCCLSFIEEIFYSGVLDTHHQGLFLLLMALSDNKEVSKLKLGRISEHTKGLIRLIYSLMKIKFKITEIEDDDYDQEINEEEEEEELEDDNDDDVKQQEEENEIDPNKEKNPKSLLFQCVGLGLKNVARIEI